MWIASIGHCPEGTGSVAVTTLSRRGGEQGMISGSEFLARIKWGHEYHDEQRRGRSGLAFV